MASFIYIPEVASGGFLLQGTPTVTGTRIVGQTLTCNITTVTPNPLPGGATSSFQWRRNGINISGATNSTYVLQSADSGQNISCVYSATLGADTSYVITPAVAILYTVVDEFPTDVFCAYGLRLFRAGYTGPLITVRRASDNSTVDVFPDLNPASANFGQINTTTISAHCGTSQGFITTNYDQIGTNHLTNTDPTTQFRIWDGTGIETRDSIFAMNSRYQATPTTQAGGRLTVVGSAAAGTFNFLHDGTTPYTIHTIASTNPGQACYYAWTSASGNTNTGLRLLSGSTNFIGATILNGATSVSGASLSNANFLSSSIRALITSQITLSQNLVQTRNRFNINQFAGVGAGTVNAPGTGAPFRDFFIGNDATGLSGDVFQYQALLIYRTEANAIQVRQRLYSQYNFSF